MNTCSYPECTKRTKSDVCYEHTDERMERNRLKAKENYEKKCANKAKLLSSSTGNDIVKNIEELNNNEVSNSNTYTTTEIATSVATEVATNIATDIATDIAIDIATEVATETVTEVATKIVSELVNNKAVSKLATYNLIENIELLFKRSITAACGPRFGRQFYNRERTSQIERFLKLVLFADLLKSAEKTRAEDILRTIQALLPTMEKYAALISDVKNLRQYVEVSQPVNISGYSHSQETLKSIFTIHDPAQFRDLFTTNTIIPNKSKNKDQVPDLNHAAISLRSVFSSDAIRFYEDYNRLDSEMNDPKWTISKNIDAVCSDIILDIKNNPSKVSTYIECFNYAYAVRLDNKPHYTSEDIITSLDNPNRIG